ncbi:hypothetical protein Hanom_Chr04g00335831 [Helianthus anomalus]
MSYTVMEHKLGINVQAVYNDLEIQRVEQRRIQREKELAEAATQKKKSVVIDNEEILGSSSHPEGTDVEMTEAKIENETVKVDQRKRKARKPDTKLLCYKEEKVEEEEEKLKDEELKRLFYEIDNYDPKNDNDDDDDDQGATGLLVVKPSTQHTLDDFLNDQLNEQQDDQQQESFSSSKQHADQVFLTQPKVIYLHSAFEGELEVPKTTKEILEKLGMDDGNLKFDIEDDIPSSPDREYSFSFPNEADNFNVVIVEE